MMMIIVIIMIDQIKIKTDLDMLKMIMLILILRTLHDGGVVSNFLCTSSSRASPSSCLTAKKRSDPNMSHQQMKNYPPAAESKERKQWRNAFATFTTGSEKSKYSKFVTKSIYHRLKKIFST